MGDVPAMAKGIDGIDSTMLDTNWQPRGRETGLVSSSSLSTQEPKNRAEVPSASRCWRRIRDGNCLPLTMSLFLLSVFSKKPNHFFQKDDLDQPLYFKNKETEGPQKIK